MLQLNQSLDHGSILNSKNLIKILYVEDDLDDVYLVEDYLRQVRSKDYFLVHATNIDEAQKVACSNSFDVILLDLSVGEQPGMHTLHQILSINIEIPVVVFTGNEDDSFGEELIRAGASDYLPKSQANSSLLARVMSFAIERHYLLRQLHHRAYEDGLTGLLNREAILERAQLMVNQANRKPLLLAFVMIDLDGFKEINDTYGHAVGDEILKYVGSRIRESTRETDFAGRMGGDEFLLLYLNFLVAEDLEQLINTFLDKIHQPMKLYVNSAFIDITLGCSIGVSFYKSGMTVKKSIVQADNAMYVSKKNKDCKVTWWQ